MGNFPTPKKRPWQISTAPPPQSGRKNPNQAFYNSRKWRLNRGRYIKKNPLCVICQASGIVKKGDVVDHIITINDGGEKYKWVNLQTMCHSHHNQKSGRESQAAQKDKKNESNS
jgi:5-methylcytosine-specific restriction endonuclease McrA